jgi:DNA-binding transcriptional regulator LsrR (DeoR family)
MVRPVETVGGDSLLSAGRLALSVAAARRFHLEGATKVQIAQELGISRFKVARLLDLARSASLVEIRVGMPPGIDDVLSERLRHAYGLQHALVVAGGDESRIAVGRTAAGLLGELTGPEDVVGLAWGRSMSEMAKSWAEQVPATFVQLAGALARPDVDHNAPDLVRSVAAAAGGTAATFYAPLLMPDAASAQAIRQQVGVREALALMDDLTRAVVSIGAWGPGESTVHDALDPPTQRAMRARGVVAEVTGLLLTGDGAVVDDLADRIVSVTDRQLRAVPHVIALAPGAERTHAATAVLRSGLIDAMVVPSSLAEQILA